MQPAQDSMTGVIHEPVIVHEPEVRTSPFIFASPHSGRCYEEAFLKQVCAPLSVLRRSEDAYVDQFFQTVTELGASFVEAKLRLPPFQAVVRLSRIREALRNVDPDNYVRRRKPIKKTPVPMRRERGHVHGS